MRRRSSWARALGRRARGARGAWPAGRRGRRGGARGRVGAPGRPVRLVGGAGLDAATGGGAATAGSCARTRPGESSRGHHVYPTAPPKPGPACWMVRPSKEARERNDEVGRELKPRLDDPPAADVARTRWTCPARPCWAETPAGWLVTSVRSRMGTRGKTASSKLGRAAQAQAAEDLAARPGSWWRGRCRCGTSPVRRPRCRCRCRPTATRPPTEKARTKPNSACEASRR